MKFILKALTAVTALCFWGYVYGADATYQSPYTQTFISEVIVASSDLKDDGTKKLLQDAGYTPTSVDCNEDAGGKYVFIGYKTSTHPEDAITSFIIASGDYSNSDTTVTVNGITYKRAYTLRKYGNGNLNEEEWIKYVTALNTLSDKPIYIDDTAGNTVGEIRSKCRKLATSPQGLDVVVIDYLTLIQGTSKGNANRQQEVSTISRMIKLLARRIEAPIIALAQLSRDVEKRGGAPRLSDLRESGSLEQDADIVMFLHSLEDNQAEGEGPVKAAGPKQRAEVIRVDLMISKHRNGALRNIPLSLDRRYGLFHEFDYGYDNKEGK